MDAVFTSLEKKILAVFTIDKAADFVRNVVNIRGQFQQLEVAFTTLLKSEEKANKLMAQAVDLAAKTPFDLQGVASGARQLLAYGFEAENVTDVLRRLGDVAAGLGLPLQRLTYLYGTTRVQGRLYARDMLQFTNSGIPLLDELAKMYGKTTAEINEMVSAGKIGFSDVEKVIKKMTDAGGQFDNLMSKQSTTITGQMSNIKDSIDVMFNEIGKNSEGFINNALAGISSLVENYEKVGKAIAILIAIYGAEKAAVAAVSVAKAAATMVTNGYTAAEVRQYYALLASEKAQKLLNATLLKNPYVLAAAALTAVTMAIIKHVKANNDMSKAIGETTAKIQDETNELDRLFAVAKNEKVSKDERKKAIDTINARYGDYLDNLLTEKDSVEKLTGAYKNLSAAITEKYLEQMREQTVGARQTSYNEAESDLWGEVKKIVGASGLSSGRQGAMTREMQAWISKFSKYNNAGETYNALMDIYGKYGGKDMTARQQGNLYGKVWDFKDTQYQLSLANKEFNEFASGYNTVSKQLQEDAKADTTFTTITDEIKAAREELDKLKKEEKDLRSGKRPAGADTTFSFESALAENAKAQKAAQGKIDTLTGSSSKETKQNATEAQKAAQKVADAQYELDRKRIQQKISALQMEKDGELANAEEIHKLKLELIDKEEAHQLAAIDREIESASTGAEKTSLQQLKTIVSSTATVDRSSLENEDNKSYKENLEAKLSTYQNYAGRRKVIDEQLRRDLELLEEAKKKATGDTSGIDNAIEGLNRQIFENSGLAEFETYEEKRIEIQKKYKDLRNQAEAEGNAERLRLIIEGEQQAISELDAQELMASETWKKLFLDLGGLTAKEISTMIDTVESQLDGLNLSPIDYQTVVDNLNRAKTELETKNPFAGLKKFWEDYKKTEDKNSKSQAITGIKKSFDSIGGSLTTAGGALSNMFASFGNEELGEGIGTACDLLGEMGTAAGGVAKIMSGDILGGISDIITGLANIVTIFNQIHDKKLQKQIEADQKIIDGLKTAYDELAEAVSNAFGKNASAKLDEMNSKLVRQMELIEDQKRLEEEKKKTDNDAINGYNEQLDDIRKTIEDNKTAAIDAILGEDIQSAISNFSSAITDAWAKGNGAAQGAKDYAKKMLQNTITEAVKAYIQASQAMERIRQTMLDAMADDIITEDEKVRIEQQAQALADEVERKFGWADSFFQEEDANAREAATKNSLGASQESVDESNGRLTALQGKAEDIYTEQKAQSGILSDLRAQSSSILEEVMGIHDDTMAIRSAVGEIHNIAREIRSGVGTITDRGVKML